MQPVSSELVPPTSSSNTGKVVAQEPLAELMVHVKEAAVHHKLDVLVMVNGVFFLQLIPLWLAQFAHPRRYFELRLRNNFHPTHTCINKVISIVTMQYNLLTATELQSFFLLRPANKTTGIFKLRKDVDSIPFLCECP